MMTKKRIAIGAGLLGLCLPALAQRPVEAVALFQPVAAPVTAVAALQPAATPVAVQYSALEALTPGQAVTLAVSPIGALAGTVRRIETRKPGRYSVFGRIDNDPDGFFVLTVEHDVVVGMLQSYATGESYRLEHLAPGVAQIRPIDQASFPPCGLPRNAGGADADGQDVAGQTPVPGAGAGAGGGSVELGTCAAPPRHFDVILYYTDQARRDAGGTTAMQAECQNAVDVANETYDDSEISARIVLVFAEEVTYNESSDMENDRDRLQDDSDGILDFVHDDRDAFGADFVSLFVDDSDADACGIAYCTPSGSEEGFCIVQRGCASSNFSFVHEIGHLQGCAHNKEDAGSGCNEWCYSYGSRFFGDSGAGWRTVMAYDNDDNDFTRIGKFSNPSVNHDGEPTGYDCPFLGKGADNARTINGTTIDREGWRSPKFEVWVEKDAPLFWSGTFQDPWPTVAIGAAAVYGGADTPLVQPELWIKSATYDESVSISKAMTLRACGGSVTIVGQ